MDTTFELIALFGGIQVVLTGLVGFLGKVWISRIHERDIATYGAQLEEIKSSLQATNQRLQAALEKSVFVHKVQFESEFKIYSELWRGLCRLRVTLRKWQDNSHEVGVDSNYEPFVEAYQSLHEIVETQRPFYSAEVAKQLFRLMGYSGEIVKHRVAAIRRNTERELSEFEREQGRLPAVTSIEELNDIRRMTLLTNEICESIRCRITGGEVEVDEKGLTGASS